MSSKLWLAFLFSTSLSLSVNISHVPCDVSHDFLWIAHSDDCLICITNNICWNVVFVLDVEDCCCLVCVFVDLDFEAEL